MTFYLPDWNPDLLPIGFNHQLIVFRCLGAFHEAALTLRAQIPSENQAPRPVQEESRRQLQIQAEVCPVSPSFHFDYDETPQNALLPR